MNRVLPLKRVARVRFSSVDKKSNEGEIPVRLCNYTDVYYRDSITRDVPFMEATATPTERREFSLSRDDVLITKDSESPDDIGIPSYVSFSDETVLCGYHLAQIRPDTKRVDGKYLYWWMASDVMREELSSRANGITRFGLKLESIATAPVPLPALPEQQAIADFLDRETARVDALIDKKHQISTLLRERIRTLISEVVTGSLDVTSREEFRRSPARPIGAFADIQLGRQRTPRDDQGPHMVAYLRAANVKDGTLELSDVKRMNFSPSEQRVFALSPGDVLITEGAGSLAAVGASTIWNGEIAGTVCFQNTLIRLRPRSSNIRPDFLHWWARHAYGSGLFAAEATGANIFHLGADHLRTVRVTLPSPEGQEEIVRYLQRAAEQSHQLISRQERQLQLLRERRQTLITAAVTGQMEVLSTA